MPLTLNDLEPGISEAVLRTARKLRGRCPEDKQLSEAERRACRLIKEQEAVEEAALAKQTMARTWWISLSGISIPFLCLLFGSRMFPYFLIAFMVVGAGILVAGSSPKSREKDLLPPVIGALLPVAVTNRAESRYTDALLALEEASALLTEASRSDLLHHLNALLGNYRKVTARKKEIGRAGGKEGVATLEKERTALTERWDKAADPEARATLESSLRLLDTRLERARALLPLTERLDAQAEMICQALASTGEALRTLRLAPVSSSATTAAPDVAEIEEIVTRVNRQTQAVEQAVAEVMTLRGGRGGG